MPSYETLDTIADAYIPGLAILSLGFIALAVIKAQWRIAGAQLLAVIATLAIAYALMFFDNKFKVWPVFGLDYSTHTAVSLVLVAFLCASKPRLSAFWLGSFIAYVLLMLYQGYHTVSDVLVTAAIVIVPAWLVIAYCCNRWPMASAKHSINGMP